MGTLAEGEICPCSLYPFSRTSHALGLCTRTLGELLSAALCIYCNQSACKGSLAAAISLQHHLQPISVTERVGT